MPDALTEEEKTRRVAEMDYQDRRQEVFERLKIQATMADGGLKALMLVNGGALVALFSLIGSGHVKIQPHDWHIWGAFTSFAAGTAFTVGSNFCAFLTQGFYYRQTQEQAWRDQALSVGRPASGNPERFYRMGFRAEVVGVVLAVLAVFTFIAGALFALEGVSPGS